MRTWSFMQWVVAVILVCAAVAILLIALPAMGITIPPVFIQIIWILIIAFFAIAAIGLLMRLWNGWGGGPPAP